MHEVRWARHITQTLERIGLGRARHLFEAHPEPKLELCLFFAEDAKVIEARRLGAASDRRDERIVLVCERRWHAIAGLKAGAHLGQHRLTLFDLVPCELPQCRSAPFVVAVVLNLDELVRLLFFLTNAPAVRAAQVLQQREAIHAVESHAVHLLVTGEAARRARFGARSSSGNASLARLVLKLLLKVRHRLFEGAPLQLV